MYHGSIRIFIILSFVFGSCVTLMTNHSPRVQGHRGSRGLLPENTLPAFQKAMELGVNTLEMDVVISKDGKVVVSHEPFFNHLISLTPDKKELKEEEEKKHNLYQMTYEEIKQYDVGSKEHPDFPQQKRMPVYKPLLSAVFEYVDKFSLEKKQKEPEYNIEIKRVPTQDGLFHPTVDVFVELVVQEIKKYKKEDKVILQSFDIETLQLLHQKYPEFRLAFLIENEQSIAQNIEKLGFIPWAYSPDFTYLNDSVFDYAQKHQIKVIPWTVNEEEDIQKVMTYPVYSIISDYPDRVIELIK